MSEVVIDVEQREHERFKVEFPLTYKLGKILLTGSTVDACNQGIRIESYVSPKKAPKVFKMLYKNPRYKLEIEYVYEGKSYVRDAEVRHFEVAYSGSGSYRFTIGFFIPRIE